MNRNKREYPKSRLATLGKTLSQLGAALALLIGCAALGQQKARQTKGWLAYLARDYRTAYDRYAAAGDERGKALALVALHEPGAAFECFRRAGDDAGLGLSCLENREPAKAFGYFSKAGDRNGQALALLALNRTGEAEQLFAAEGNLDGVGLVALQRGQTAAAREHFEKAGNLSGAGLADLQERRWKSAWENFSASGDAGGMALVALGRRDYALAETTAARGGVPSAAGAACMARNQFDRAERWFKVANDYNALGDLYARFDNWAAARQAFDAANNPVKVLQCWRRDNHDPEATAKGLAYVRETLGDPDCPTEFLLEAADHLYDCGQIEQAFGCLDLAEKNSGWQGSVGLRRGRLLVREGRLEEARKVFTQIRRDTLGGAEERRGAEECLATLSISR